MKTADALVAVDEALRTGAPGAADPAERELQEIALALRADSPRPDPEFAARLDRRVATRFAQERPARSVLPRRRLLLAGAAGLVVAVGIVGAVAGLSGQGGGERPFEARPAALPAERAEPQAAPAREPEARTAVPEPGDAAAAGRRVERAAELTLAAPADRLDDVANDVVQVTDRHRGVVLDSSVATGSDPARGAAFTLRVPATELSQTLRDLSRLGQVRARSESGHDVTRSYDRLRDRLDAARGERRALASRLGHARSRSEADGLRTRIELVTREIRSLREQVGQVEARSDYTRIAVTLVEQRRAASPLGGAGDALRGSLRALVGAVAVTLRVIAAILPFALLGGLAWAATAAVRRRQREAALS